MKTKRLVIVAFDGLDYQKIKKYGCESVAQDEFGKIDLSDFDKLVTQELWTSFITGKRPLENGIKGHYKLTNERINYVEQKIKHVLGLRRFRGLRWSIYESLNFLGCEKRAYERSDINNSTIFEEIPDSVAIDIPGYTQNTFIQRAFEGLKFDKGIEVALRDARAEFEYRKSKFFRELEEEHKLVMVHFQYPDIVQHLVNEESEKEREAYAEIDNLAKRIKERCNEDRVLFCSDHGLWNGDHRKEAFWSTNFDIDLQNPKITEFHDIIVEHLDTMKAEEIEGIRF